MNIVLVLVDSLRKDHIGAYGNDWIQPPNIDALAGESLRFTQVRPESVPSIPARRGIHTGLRSFPFRGWERTNEYDVNLWGWQPMPEDQIPMAQTLKDNGYQTLLVTDTLHQFRPSYNFQKGFDSFHFVRGQERDLFRPASLVKPEALDRALIGGPNEEHAREIIHQYFANTLGRQREEDWFTPQVFTKAMEFLEAGKNQQPFFLVVDNYDPHEPWDPPEKYVSLYDEGYEGPEPLTSSSGSSDWLTERQLKRMHALYSGEVTMMDRWLGNFLDKMAELNLMENTLLLFISDHGHAFGEHGVAGKVTTAMYPELMDVPLMIRHPEGKKAGSTSDYFASTHDVAPTLLAAAGLEPGQTPEGQNLNVLLDGGEPEQKRPYFTSSYHDQVWARDEDYVMISRNDGEKAQLFDLRSDPDQNKNIAWRNSDIVQRMFKEYVLKDAGGPLPRY